MNDCLVLDTFPLPHLNMSAILSTPAPTLDFVLPGLLTGTVGAVIAPGATGKSMSALQLAVALATGTDACGLGVAPSPCSVLVLAAEDPVPILHQRLQDVCIGMDSELIKDNLIVCPLLGQQHDFAAETDMTANRISKIFDIRGRGSVRLVVIDTLSRFHSGDENDRRDACRVMRILEQLAVYGNAAVVFLHHVSKAAALNGQSSIAQAAKGSAVWTDEARWVAFLSGMSVDEAAAMGKDEMERKGYVRFGLNKTNYCAQRPDIWLKRGDGGVLSVADLSIKTNGKKVVRNENWN